MMQTKVQLSHCIAVAISRTIQNEKWNKSVLYSESNATQYYHGEASVLASSLASVKTSDIPDRGEILKEETETLYIDKEQNYRFVATVRKYHYATTMTIERRKYE